MSFECGTQCVFKGREEEWQGGVGWEGHSNWSARQMKMSDDPMWGT